MSRKLNITKSIFRSLTFVGTMLLLVGVAVHPASARFSATDEGVLEGYQARAFLGGLRLSRGPAFPAPQVARIAEIAAYDHLSAGADSESPADGAIDMIETGSIVAGVFDSVAIPIRSFPVAKRWERIMRTISECAAANSCAGESQLLARISKETETKPLVEKVKLVNAIVNNTLRYRADQSLYKKLDYWATPSEILKRASGDCEDFAILKMTALMRAGVPAKSLSLVVLLDNNRGVFHAVLAVTTTSGTFILDNARAKVAMDTDLPNYQPLYSLSGNRAWIHGSKSPSRHLLAEAQDFSSIAPGEDIPSSREPDEAVLSNASLRPGLPVVGAL